MKIICTEDEKEMLLNCSTFPPNEIFDCHNCHLYISCRECKEKNIEWEITPSQYKLTKDEVILAVEKCEDNKCEECPLINIEPCISLRNRYIIKYLQE